jgi:hypothetical protein
VRRLRSVLATAGLAVTAAVLLPATAAQADPALPTWATEIRNHASDNCLDQSWSGGHENATVLVYNCLGGSNQLWKFKVVNSANQDYMIENSRSGKCLNQDYSGNVRHSNVIAYTCSTAFANGVWRAAYISNGRWAFRNTKSGDWLNQDWSGGAPRSAALAWPGTEADLPGNSMWYFILE